MHLQSSQKAAAQQGMRTASLKSSLQIEQTISSGGGGRPGGGVALSMSGFSLLHEIKDKKSKSNQLISRNETDNQIHL